MIINFIENNIKITIFSVSFLLIGYLLGVIIGDLNLNNIISNILGLFGIVISLLAFYLTYISFVNPRERFSNLLKNKNNWSRFYLFDDDAFYVYQHKKYSNYQIDFNKDQPIAINRKEEWFPDFPDKENKVFSVKLKFNGILLMEELFISFDGGNYFIPFPRKDYIDGKVKYYYEEIQEKLANIIGQYYKDKDLKDFLKNKKLK